MKPVLIGGIGNVLLGDDGVGPYVVRMLEARYDFGDDVEIADLGTPALDLLHRIAGRHAVILLDCVASAEEAPGTVVQYRKEDILRIAPTPRLDPHSPALSECLLTAEMLGASPDNVLLVGIVGQSVEPSCRMSPAARDAVESAIEAVFLELEFLGCSVEKKAIRNSEAIWWTDDCALQAEQ
ncbi:MAG TPA: hydrogenase maturation protease [Dongiaceae bacterium]|nr:hydrogenase maturation protease [Dongiaceae bacterium]